MVLKMNAKLRIATAMIIFGSMGLFVRNINLPSNTIALVRGIIGVIFLAIVSLSLEKTISKKAIVKNGLLLIILGITLSINWIFLFEAYKHTTIATATLSYYLAPVFVALLSPLVLKEKLTTTKFVCITTSLIGMILVSGALTKPFQGIEDFIGIGYGIAAAVSYASLTLLNKFTKESTAIEATIAQLGVASVVLFLYVFLTTDFGDITIEIKEILLLSILGVIHTGLGFWLYFSSIQDLKAQTVAAFSYIDPVTAIVLSTLILGEKMGIAETLGAVLILGSTLISERVRKPVSRKYSVKNYPLRHANSIDKK